jgi:hypothetical protein
MLRACIRLLFLRAFVKKTKYFSTSAKRSHFYFITTNGFLRVCLQNPGDGICFGFNLESMKPDALLAVSVIGLVLLAISSAAFAQGDGTKSTTALAQEQGPKPSQKELSDDLIEKTRASRKSLEKLLAIYEKQLQSQSADYEARKDLYKKDLISKLELEESERAVANTRFQIEQVKRWIAENDIALAEALAREELRRLPPLPLGGYSETAALIRYNGAVSWSLADAGKIEKFFAERFGHELPVSAMGQTPVHEHMRFDHRDAMDIAVHPDSVEGRALMAYLRSMRIPFIAFRAKMSGSATGAHIHVGRPSLRLLSPASGGSSVQ